MNTATQSIQNCAACKGSGYSLTDGSFCPNCDGKGFNIVQIDSAIMRNRLIREQKNRKEVEK